MNLTRWEPFAETDRMLNGMLSGNFWRMPRIMGDQLPAVQWSPTADISETDAEYLIRAELPAVPKEGIKVEIEGGVLTLEGERKYEKEESKEKYHRKESFQGRFSRAFTLPDNVDAASIRAESKDGVLTVHLPKKKVEAAKPMQVKIG